ncbi:MAG TPA: hypothetical protein VG755_40595 [Nannocystaceae bacterium]|nr:hypothetical protein [Nannocystaceae bacterium]
MKLPLRSTIAAIALAVIGCATYSDRTEAARDAMQRGDVAGGVKELNKFLKVRKSEELPNKWKKDFELVILERATMLQALGLYELSARDYEVADKQLELLDIARDGAGKLGKYIYSDSATKYKTSPTEKLSINAMNMCNYLARGDLDGAKIEAKRFTVMRKYLSDYDPEHGHGAFGSYLAGFVYEQLGDANEALRYYDEALQDQELASLRGPIEKLAKVGSYRGDRIKDYLPPELQGPGFTAPPKSDPPKSDPPATDPPATDPPSEAPKSDAPPVQRPSGATPPTPQSMLGALPSSPAWAAADAPKAGELLVITKTGRVPFKVPRRIPIGAAIGLAGAYVTGDTTLLEYGMFKVVTYPELVPHRTIFEDVEMSLDGHELDADLATELTGELVREYDDIKPKIIGAAITRMIARAAAAEAGRAAGQQAKEGGGIIGFLAAAAIEGTLVALDRPDTRSWTTLPARIFVARATVPAGKHELVVKVHGPGGWQRRKMQVDVPASGFAVVDVTTLR